ncbi:hypothetical protein GNI_162860 [Gregarina niphandrodes]|uniref:Uncharacterized protein n=1 Tax=Gregarina niphandrodes TaxID=110365 RepID=A0A023AYY7_GRENI|nr:hypothetical protein GNI_162860 [Gregarina niphandrodes]EZG43673.1 hypothetical protein GNI_162860 [Gregarina niphandrodes]|eukprot:XP_011133099.1 hypothetical protein GNI_162860 [Gregarina niphandrodes]
MNDPNGSLAQQYEKLQASLPPSMRIIQPWAAEGKTEPGGADAASFPAQYQCTVIKEEDSDGISISSESVRLGSGNVVKSVVWDAEAGKMWTDPEEYQRHMTHLINDRSRQTQSAKKYLFKEDMFDLVMPSGLSLGEAGELLESCEGELQVVEKVVLSVEDEGLFRVREETIEPYFAGQLGWTSGQECLGDSSVTGKGECGRRFSVDQETLMQMDPSDRAVVTDMVAVVTAVQQRRLAIERNRRRLHVLIEDGIKSVELYSAYLNALRAYDSFLLARAAPRWGEASSPALALALANAEHDVKHDRDVKHDVEHDVEQDVEHSVSSDEDTNLVTNDLLARVDNVFNHDLPPLAGRLMTTVPANSCPVGPQDGDLNSSAQDRWSSGSLHTSILTGSDSLAALRNYRRVILRTCVNSLMAKRHEIFGLSTILNESRIWSEDLLERAVKLEKLIQSTVDELIQGPFPLLPVAPPVITDWLNETEQAAHTCATVSYILTTKAKLHPKALNHAETPSRNNWVLGIPLFESFLVEDSSSATDSDQN